MRSAIQSTLILVFCFTLTLAQSSLLSAAQNVPHEVGGFTLGSDVNDYPNMMDTNFLKEMVVTDWRGFRKGVISYGICKYENKILRIRMKYEDSSKKYYQELLNEYKKVYGAPQEWKGDSFGILHIWKWYFTDSENRAVSLTLQHNLRNPNENIGNMVKLSFPDMIEDERLCFNQMCEEMKSTEDKKHLEELKKADDRYLIPR
jgi:hypothetical protein